MYLINNFKRNVDDELGRGGTAVVYRINNGLNGPAALKLPLESVESELFHKLIKREEQLIGNLKYPGIVQLIDCHTTAEPYLVLELCQGPSLESVGRIESISLALNILSSIAINLEYIHARGIIHADLKPDNIFLPPHWRQLTSDKLFYSKLSDFSLGRFVDEDESQRCGLGTLGYMAPETISSKTVSIKSDLFALGVTAYQILSGCHPFIKSDTDPVIINSRVTEKVHESILNYCPNLPQTLVKLIDRLLNKDVNKRPESAMDVCRELKTIGCNYPYEKVIKPKYFIDKNHKIDNWYDNFQSFKERNNDIANIVGDSSKQLRLLLSYNETIGNLNYSNYQFELKNKLVIPSYFRKQLLSKFKKLTITKKKELIKAAVVGRIDSWAKLENADIDKMYSFSDYNLETLKQFLNLHSIVRISRKYIDKAIELEDRSLAARLAVASGQLEIAEEQAYQASVSYFNDNRPDDALSIINHVIRAATILKRTDKVKSLLKYKGFIHKQTGAAEESLLAYLQVIDCYKDKPADILLAETYKELGDLYKMKQNCSKGIETLKKAEEIYRQLDDQLELSHTFNNIGNIYWIEGNQNDALHYYREALKIQKINKVYEDSASTLNNIGVVYVTKGRFERAIRLFNLSLKHNIKAGKRGEAARTLNNLGYISHLLNHNSEAIDYLKDARKINDEIGSQKELLFNLENMTEIMLKAGRPFESIKNLKEGLYLADKLNDLPHQAIFSYNMGKVLTIVGKIDEARRWLEKAEQFVASIDDIHVAALVKLQKAYICFLIGNFNEASKLEDEIKIVLPDITDKTILIDVYLQLNEINYKKEYVGEIEKLSAELELQRPVLINQLLTIHANLNQHKINKPKILIDELSAYLESYSEDIIYSDLLLTLSKLYQLDNKNEQAALMLDRALSFSEKSKLIFKQIEANIQQGKLKFGDEDYEKCYQNYFTALTNAKQIGSSISDNAEVEMFLNIPLIKNLAKDIQNLQNIIHT